MSPPTSHRKKIFAGPHFSVKSDVESGAEDTDEVSIDDNATDKEVAAPSFNPQTTDERNSGFPSSRSWKSRIRSAQFHRTTRMNFWSLYEQKYTSMVIGS